MRVQNNHSKKVADTFVHITIENIPKIIGNGFSESDFEAVAQFIKRNYAMLLQYWNQEIDAGEFIERMKRG